MQGNNTRRKKKQLIKQYIKSGEDIDGQWNDIHNKYTVVSNIDDVQWQRSYITKSV